MLSSIHERVKPLIYFGAVVARRKIAVNHTRLVSAVSLRSAYVSYTKKYPLLRLRPRRLQKLHIFTKNGGPNKLYVDNNDGLFLSSGIVLRFMNYGSSRYLKKRLKTWHNYIKAIRLLQRRRFILFMSDMVGKKSVIFSKLVAASTKRSRKVRPLWVFIKLFNTSAPRSTRSARRIKR